MQAVVSTEGLIPGASIYASVEVAEVSSGDPVRVAVVSDEASPYVGQQSQKLLLESISSQEYHLYSSLTDAREKATIQAAEGRSDIPQRRKADGEANAMYARGMTYDREDAHGASGDRMLSHDRDSLQGSASSGSQSKNSLAMRLAGDVSRSGQGAGQGNHSGAGSIRRSFGANDLELMRGQDSRDSAEGVRR